MGKFLAALSLVTLFFTASAAEVDPWKYIGSEINVVTETSYDRSSHPERYTATDLYTESVGNAVIQYNVGNQVQDVTKFYFSGYPKSATYTKTGVMAVTSFTISNTESQDLYVRFLKGGDYFTESAGGVFSYAQDNVGYSGDDKVVVGHDIDVTGAMSYDDNLLGSFAMLNDKADDVYMTWTVSGENGDSVVDSNDPSKKAYAKLLSDENGHYYIGVNLAGIENTNSAGAPAAFGEFDFVFDFMASPKGQPLPGVLATLLFGSGCFGYGALKRRKALKK